MRWFCQDPYFCAFLICFFGRIAAVAATGLSAPIFCGRDRRCAPVSRKSISAQSLARIASISSGGILPLLRRWRASFARTATGGDVAGEAGVELNHKDFRNNIRHFLNNL
jgi:hypothetical protein